MAGRNWRKWSCGYQIKRATTTLTNQIAPLKINPYTIPAAAFSGPRDTGGCTIDSLCPTATDDSIRISIPPP